MSVQNILVVDDEPDIRDLVQEILMDEGYEVKVAEDTTAARQHAHQQQPDLVLLDIWMPGEDGISLLKDWSNSGGIQCPVVMMSGHGTVETAVEATRLGAFDFIEKPLTTAKLIVSVKRALEANEIKAQKKELTLIKEEPIGASKIMNDLRDQAKKLAKLDTLLLITGESGVGKKTFASYIHALSDKQDNRFVMLSEESFNDQKAIKELFGSEKNEVITPGVLELAKGGTIYINDVAKINKAGQKILLHLLQTKQFNRVNGSDNQQLLARVIVATQADLKFEVQSKHFSEELYFLLNVVPVRIPSLSEHLEDVPDLIRYYIDFYCSQENYPYRNFTIAAQNSLLHYPWPGNIRELRNLVQRLLILSASDEISSEEVELALNESGTPVENHWHEDLYKLPLREARESFERGYLLHQLKQVNGNISKLADLVGLERTHLYRKLRTLGINTKDS